jgi:hypothetical protein
MKLIRLILRWILGPEEPQPHPHYSYTDRCTADDLTQDEIDYFNSLSDWR